MNIIFNSPPESTGSLDIESPILNSGERFCESYAAVYTAFLKTTVGLSVPQQEIYTLVGVVCSFALQGDDSKNPFVPRFQFADSRGAIPEDLSGPDIEALKHIAQRVTDLSLKARIYDVLFEINERFDHVTCLAAASAYIENAEKLVEAEHNEIALNCYRRGLRLAYLLGKSGELYSRAIHSFKSAIESVAKRRSFWQVHDFLHLYLDLGGMEYSEMADLCEKLARRSRADSTLPWERNFYELASKWHARNGDEDSRKRTRIASVETYVLESERRFEEVKGARYAVAAGILRMGIEAMIRAEAPKDRIDKLKVRLSKLQEHAAKEMPVVETPIEVTDSIRQAQDFVRADSIMEAISRMVLIAPLFDPAEIRTEVEKKLSEFKLQSLFSIVLTDKSGRSTFRMPGALETKGKEKEKRIKNECFIDASGFRMPLRAQIQIDVARQQIYNDFVPQMKDFFPIVFNNPFVPPGHELIFLKGIHAGFHGDFSTSAHLLVPQIENSIRYIFKQNGLPTSVMKEGEIEEVKGLRVLIGSPEASQIFGRHVIFELQTVLTEKAGFQLRDRLAHGLVSEREGYATDCVTLWWLVIWICMHPHLNRYLKKEPAQKYKRQVRSAYGCRRSGRNRARFTCRKIQERSKKRTSFR